MPRYFFFASDTGADDTAVDLSDHAAARRYAIRYAGEVMNDQPEVLWDGREFSVTVRDETGLLLFTVAMIAINAPAGGDTK